MQKTISVPKKEYEDLKNMAERFQFLQKFFTQDFFVPPPTKQVPEVMKELRKTGKYNQAFLKSLERGLKDSKYFSGT